MAGFHCISETRCLLGECPRWHAGEQRVYWTDIDGKRLLRVGLDGKGEESVDMERKVGCFVFRKKGGMLLAMEDGIFAGDPFAGGRLRQVCPHPFLQLAADRGRFNDGRCDPAGRFIVGTLDPKREYRAAFYALEPGRKALRKVQSSFNTFNGIAFSPDGSEVRYSDTPLYELYCSKYDPATGLIGEREVLRKWDRKKEPARPDGGAFDSKGDYWCAMYAGGRVLRIDGEGNETARLDLPATYTTMVAFAGEKLDRMVVTTAQREDDPDETRRNPDAGRLFLFDKKFAPGLPEPVFPG